MLVMSPSNILNHMKCPLQAWALREKQIQWRDSPQKARGTEVHSCLEQAVKQDFQLKEQVLPDDVQTAYISTVLNKLQLLVHAHKLEVFAEKDLAVTSKFTPTGFFGEDAFFRCRADLLLVSPKGDYAIIGDWKTGKIYDYSENQMRLETLLVSTIYKVPLVHWKLFYVDQGITKDGTVNYRYGLDPVKDLLAVMKEMQALSKSNGPWLAKKNGFCKWCEWYHSKCEDSLKW